MLTNQSIGYMDAPIPKGLDLKEEINRMRREKNAVILAHYYQTGDIQDIADFVGDSLALAQQAANVYQCTSDSRKFSGRHEDYLRPRPELRQLHKWYYRTQDGALGWCLPCA